MREKLREVAVYREQIALLPEYQYRSTGGNILEGDAAVKFGRAEQNTGGAADLYRLRIRSAAIVQHLPDGYAERVFINARSLAIAADTEEFAAC